MKTKIDKVYCDLDGVVANFHSHCYSILNLAPEEVAKNWNPNEYHNFYKAMGFNEPNECWEALRRKQPNHTKFWEEIPPFEWSVEMLDYLCTNFNVEILSTPNRHRAECEEGKTRWLKKHGFGHIKPNYSAFKYKYASEHALLIDDMPTNVSGFIAAGGHAIEFPQFWNNGGKRDNPWHDVKLMLEKYERF